MSDQAITLFVSSGIGPSPVEPSPHRGRSTQMRNGGLPIIGRSTWASGRIVEASTSLSEVPQLSAGTTPGRQITSALRHPGAVGLHKGPRHSAQLPHVARPAC